MLSLGWRISRRVSSSSRVAKMGVTPLSQAWLVVRYIFRDGLGGSVLRER